MTSFGYFVKVPAKPFQKLLFVVNRITIPQGNFKFFAVPKHHIKKKIDKKY